MNVSADTNVLVRLMVGDNTAQTQAAAEALSSATTVAVAVTSLCEFVWVLRRVYGLSRRELVSAVTSVLETKDVAVDRIAVEAGLAALRAGADFADGVIAHQCRVLGSETFVTFDRKAASALEKQGFSIRLLR